MKAFLICCWVVALIALAPRASFVDAAPTGNAGKIDFKNGSAWYGIISGKVATILLSDTRGEGMAKASSTSVGRKAQGFLTCNGQKVEISCFSSDGETSHCSVGKEKVS